MEKGKNMKTIKELEDEMKERVPIVVMMNKITIKALKKVLGLINEYDTPLINAFELKARITG